MNMQRVINLLQKTKMQLVMEMNRQTEKIQIKEINLHTTYIQFVKEKDMKMQLIKEKYQVTMETQQITKIDLQKAKMK